MRYWPRWEPRQCHSQTFCVRYQDRWFESFIWSRGCRYLSPSVICLYYCSTDQGSILISTAESHLKAVNHTLEAGEFPNISIFDAMRRDGSQASETKILQGTYVTSIRPSYGPKSSRWWNLLCILIKRVPKQKLDFLRHNRFWRTNFLLKRSRITS